MSTSSICRALKDDPRISICRAFEDDSRTCCSAESTTLAAVWSGDRAFDCSTVGASAWTGSWVCGVLAAGLTADAGIAIVVLPHALSGTREDSGDDGSEDDDDGSEDDVDWPESWSDRRCTEGLLLRVSDGVCCLGERPRLLCEPLRLSQRPLLPLRRSVSLPPRRRELAGGVVRASCRLRLGDLPRRDRCRSGERDLLRARPLRPWPAGLQPRRGEVERDRRRLLRRGLPPRRLGAERVCLRLIDEVWWVTELCLRWPAGILEAAGCSCSGSGSGDGVSAGSGGGASSAGSGGGGETFASSVGSGGGGDEGASSAGSGGGIDGGTMV